MVIFKFHKMDLYQQEALNAVPNSVYRIALKLCAVQSLCQLDLADASLIQDILPNHQCRAEKQSSLPVQQLLQLLKELFKRVRLEKPGPVEPKAPERTLNLLTAAYDRHGEGFIQPQSAAAALIALSGDSLLTKYRVLFQLYATCGRKHSSQGIHITRNGVRHLLTDLLQILTVVGESCNLSSVETEIRSCFSGVLKSAIGEERFLAWLQSEPALLLWLPTWNRLSATKMVTHQVTCGVCKSFPITGLRYHCLKCLSFDLCQVCFFTGQYSKPHKKSHPVVEHCVPVSAKESTRLFLRTIRNNLLRGRCKRKEARRRRTLAMMGEEDVSTHHQAPSCSIQPVSSKQPVPPNWFPSAELQPRSPLHYELSPAQQAKNKNRILNQERTASQVLAPFKIDLVNTQESVKAIHSETRYLRKQLTKWKDQVQLLHSTQEDRNCILEAKLHSLQASQESLKLELQKMRQEVKNITICNKEPLKERNIQNGSGCPLLKPSNIRYSKYKSLDLPSTCTARKWLLEPQAGLLARNSGSPEFWSKFFQNADPEVAHHETPQVRSIHLTKDSGALMPETKSDQFSRVKTTSPNCFATTKACLGQKEMEEEELRQLMMKLKDALSLNVQPGQHSVLKKELLSAAEHVSKYFSDLIGQVTLPISLCQDACFGASLPDRPRRSFSTDGYPLP
ncbi:dystrotelin isoform X2 [Hemicordylus capensis]|uniref:dystrotelin isoform X2 n=1 Tax=Hemicordylus capensis TaxID=884348 RepID=UPI00230295E8|nr:dystrotelin isoform X2 [Hemicordylus capensis]